MKRDSVHRDQTPSERSHSLPPRSLPLLLAAASSLIFTTVNLTGCSKKGSGELKNIVQPPPIAEEELLEKAIDNYDDNLYTLSSESWTQLRDGYPETFYSILAELKLADAQFFAGNYSDAITAYEDFARLHPGHEAMAYVRFQIGNCSYEQYRGSTRDQAPVYAAIRAFKEVIASYPNSIYAVLARRRLQQSRERLAEYERGVAQFYEKQGKEHAATERRAGLGLNFPETPSAVASLSERGETATEVAKTTPPPTSKNTGEPSPFFMQRSAPKVPTPVPAQLAPTPAVTVAAKAHTETNTRTVPTTTEVLPKPVALRAALLGITCEEKVFIANLSSAPAMISTTQTAGGGAELTFRVQHSTLPSTNTYTCKGVTGFERQGAGNTVEVVFQLQGEAEYLILDRPHRIVFVVR